MKKDYWIDYWGYIAFKLLGPFIHALPVEASFFLGRRLGDLFYCFDGRHRTIACNNIKRALGNSAEPVRLLEVTRRFYQAFGQNLIEIFLFPRIDRAYIDKYVSFEGLDNIRQAIRRNRGQILLGVHAGSWELSSLLCLRFGFNYNIFVRNQRYPRLGALLDTYRTQKGARMIKKENELRQLIRAFRNNEAVGMSLDQGGKDGMSVDFFGKDASFATGAIRLALKYDLPIVLTFNTRVRGPRLKFILGPVFEVEKTGDLEQDVRENLKRLVGIYAEYIRQYPQDYLWSYKVWKYSRTRNILVLSDGKAGHLRQSEALARIAQDYFRQQGLDAKISVKKIGFRNNNSSFFLKLRSVLLGRYDYRRAWRALEAALDKDTYQALRDQSPDLIVSCGSALAAVNLLLARNNLSKCAVIMRPSLVGTAKFDLAAVPRHDLSAPARNIVITDGALNLVEEGYLRQQGEKLKAYLKDKQLSGVCIGLLLGGDSRGFSLDAALVAEVIRQIKEAATALGVDILVTTSRRTPAAVEALVRSEFGNYPACKFLVIATEENPEFAVGGILGLSSLLVVSPESISMVSEAVQSGKYAVVFQAPHLSARYSRFLADLAANNYIYRAEAGAVAGVVKNLFSNRPVIKPWDDSRKVREALENIL